MFGYTMRIGIDSYSFHRSLGEIRPGELKPMFYFPRGSLDVLAQAQKLGVDGISLETCYLGKPDEFNIEALRQAAGSIEIVLAWGHPHGLAFGTDGAALDNLLQWIELAPRLGCRLVRIVAASPRFRGLEPINIQIERTLLPLKKACAHARTYNVELAIENHGDLNATELELLIESVADESLGICLDTVNLLRVGDDPETATDRLAPYIKMVHLKDCEPDPGVNQVMGPKSVRYGDGVVHLDAVLSVLERKSSLSFQLNGLVCVELGHLGSTQVDERELLADCVAWLKDRLKIKSEV